MEACRNYPVKHLLFASSSSVYGDSTEVPFSENANVDKPVSLYAATKKTNELMAYTYSHLYDIPTTGLRFFTVYGPWGRPDMALFKFTKNILFDEKIGGTIHMAIGQSYSQCGGKNVSSIHWDMIGNMMNGGEIFADDQKIYDSGKFLFV